MTRFSLDSDRIKALSDGVFAIAMTLLVLGLKMPETGSDARPLEVVLLAQWPRLLSWLLSFAILARLWIIHYALLARGKHRSRAFMAWNFLFLGAISFLPFPTGLLSEHHDQALSVLVFSATLAVAGVALGGMWRASGPSERAIGSSSGRSVVLLLATAVAASAVALLWPQGGTLLWAAFPVFVVVGRVRRGSDGQASVRSSEG